MPEPFGSFGWICGSPKLEYGPVNKLKLSSGSHTVLPQCNLFFFQLFENDTPFLTTLFPESSTFFSHYNIVRCIQDLDILAD